MTLTGISLGELVRRIRDVVGCERRRRVELLRALGELERREGFLELGFSSLFTFCQGLGMAKGTAFRRSVGARLLAAFPQIGAFLDDGRVGLGTLVALRDSIDEDSVDAVLAWATGKTEVRVRETGVRVSPDPARLERVRDLLSHEVPDGNLRDVLGICVDTTIALREKRRVGGGRKHKKQHARGRYIPSFIRRRVWARDGERCAFVAGDGRRCGETRWLELHHLQAFAKGGATTVENLSVRCRAHNLMHARDDFGDQRPARICFSRSPSVAMWRSR